MVHYKKLNKIYLCYLLRLIVHIYFLIEGSAICSTGNLPKFRCYTFKTNDWPFLAPPTWIALSAKSTSMTCIYPPIHQHDAEFFMKPFYCRFHNFHLNNWSMYCSQQSQLAKILHSNLIWLCHNVSPTKIFNMALKEIHSKVISRTV
jgi:hypothetical protein